LLAELSRPPPIREAANFLKWCGGKLEAASDGRNSCSPDFSFYQVGTRTQWNRVKQLDIGLDITYTRAQHRVQRRRHLYRQRLKARTANGSKPAINVFDDQHVWSAIVRWQRNFYP
jgi:Porin subfamily